MVFLLKHHVSRLSGSPSADLTHCGSGRVSSECRVQKLDLWTPLGHSTNMVMCRYIFRCVPIWVSVGTYFAVYQYVYPSVPISLCTNVFICRYLFRCVPIRLSVGTYFAVYQYVCLSVPISLFTNCTYALSTHLRIVSKSIILTNKIRRRYAARRFSDVAISFVESRPAGNRSVVDRTGGERLFRRSAVSTGRRKAVPAVLRIRASFTDPHVAVRSSLATRAPSASQNNIVKHCRLSHDW